MPDHAVELSIPNAIDVGITDVVFRVTADGRHLGTVRISRGAIDFTKRGGKRYRLGWKRFAELMADEGRVVRQRPIRPKTARLRG
jgi:hypothetical protein